MEDPLSLEEDFVYKTSSTWPNLEIVARRRHEEVVGDTNVVGSKD